MWRLRSNQTEDPELIISGSEPAVPQSAPDGKIIFEQQLNGLRNIWSTDANGQNQKQLTWIGNNYDPSVSSDGRRIAFISDRSDRLTLWRMNSDGGSQAMVIPVDGETTPNLSPDGEWIAYDAIGFRHWTTLRRVEVTGERMKELSDRLWRMPVVSPDGRWIAGFYEDSNLSSQKHPSRIAVISSGGGHPSKLISIPPSVLIASGLRWSADGRELTYVNRRSDGDNLWSQPLNGGSARQLTQFHGGSIFRFDWSRDGKQLVFCRGVQARNVMLLQGASSAPWHRQWAAVLTYVY